MIRILNIFIYCSVMLMTSYNYATMNVGVGKSVITPPPGTPSAGYAKRKGMVGSRDPLYAQALLIDNGHKKIALCSVDHLGFTYEMVQQVIHQVHQESVLADYDIYIVSSHTHAGGGAYLNIPQLGEIIAGPYHAETTAFYVDGVVKAIKNGFNGLQKAKIGIGYGQVADLGIYRSSWPLHIQPLSNVAIIKVTTEQDQPLAIIFNYPLHPTVLPAENRLFSSDFVGDVREYLKSTVDVNIEPFYFNGAQGDIVPHVKDGEDFDAACKRIGVTLGQAVAEIWHATQTSPDIEIATAKETYTFQPQPTPFGLHLPLEKYTSEVNILVFNRTHAFVTVPGELSCVYDQMIKNQGYQLGFSAVSIMGLTNDAHGYIITPASWQHKTFESKLSFGGELYGEQIFEKISRLLIHFKP